MPPQRNSERPVTPAPSPRLFGGLSSEGKVLPIVAKARGIAYNVQKTYAGWHKGFRKQ